MARKHPENPEIQRLIRLSQASRSCLEIEVAALKRRLDFPARIRNSLREHPTTWLLGSIGSGIAASLLFRRRPAAPPKKQRGISGVLIDLTLTAARPLAKLWLSGQIKQWTAGVAENSLQFPSRAHLQHPSQPAHVHSPGPGSR